MDNYHSNLAGRGSTVAPGNDAAGDYRRGGDANLTGEDDIAPEAPPASVGQDERRMQVRAYNYWASLLGDRPFPQITDLIAAKPEFVDHAVVLDFSQSVANPAVTMLGEKLAEECGVAASIERLSDVPGRSLLSRITGHCLQILTSDAPIGFEAEFVNQRGKTLLYRGILLPFSGNGKTIEHIMGVINWKELADPLVTAELQHELEDAVGAACAHQPGQRLSAWADGPATAEPGQDAGSLTSHVIDVHMADRLAAAREAAAVADTMKLSSTAALYVAIGRAWDLALLGEADPLALRSLVAEAGLTSRTGVPMTQVVKLVFGADLDKARLAAYAMVLAYAQRRGQGHGQLTEFLTAIPGGLTRVVHDERALRRAERARIPDNLVR